MGLQLPDLGGKQLYPLSHLAGPSFSLLTVVFAYLSISNVVLFFVFVLFFSWSQDILLNEGSVFSEFLLAGI